MWTSIVHPTMLLSGVLHWLWKPTRLCGSQKGVLVQEICISTALCQEVEMGWFCVVEIHVYPHRTMHVRNHVSGQVFGTDFPVYGIY